MHATRRWLAASIVALGLLPGAERILLAHAHHGVGPSSELSATGESTPSDGLSGCVACQARATLSALGVDAHPERHGAAPAAPAVAHPRPVPSPETPPTPPARAPPLRIV